MGVSDVKIDFSGTNRIWMGVRDTDRGRRPIAKSVEFSKVSSREGLHLLGQSLREKNPFFAALFRILTHWDWDYPGRYRTGIRIRIGMAIAAFRQGQRRRKYMSSFGDCDADGRIAACDLG